MPRKKVETRELSVVEKYFIQAHRSLPPEELARTVGAPQGLIEAHLAALAPTTHFDPHGLSKGVTSMTAAQSLIDDIRAKEPPKEQPPSRYRGGVHKC